MWLLKRVVLLVSLTCVSVSAGFCTSRGQEGMITDGVDDALPKTYNLVPLELKEKRGAGMLHVGKDGQGRFSLDNPYSLKTLDKATAIKIFGPISSFGEEKPCDTFHVLAFNANGPNIFHLDVEFNAAGSLTKYRVRGMGISKPEWQSVQ